MNYDTYVEDLTKISETYPNIEEPVVSRDFLVDSILDQLENSEVVFVKWPEGYGKTTLLAQFVKKNKYRTVNLFIGSKWSYKPDSVKVDLCNQIKWAINKEELDENTLRKNDIKSDYLVNRYFRKLSRKGRKREPYYIVVDGLEAIPDRDRHAQKEIINSLPFGAAGIRFVFSGAPSLLPEDIQSKVEIETLSRVVFGKKHTEEYLSDLVNDREQLDEIHNTCQGIPGRLASVRRILEKGASAEAVLRNRIDEVKDLFDVEWKDVVKEDRKILALITFPDFELRPAEIAEVLGLNEKSVVSQLSSLSFVSVDQDSSNVSFVSEAFRRYAAKKLSDLEAEVRDAVADYLIDNMESDRSIRHLPILLDDTGRYEKLIEILSPDHFYRVLERGQSLGFINRVADLAFGAADNKQNLSALSRFSLHKSAVNELWGAHAKRSEVRALMALGEIDEAMALADTALSSVERLHLLAIIARIRKEQEGEVEKDLLDRIQRLSEDLDASDLQNRGEEIAVDLVSVDPELALRLVEQGTEAGSGEHSLDVAYLKLTFSEAMRSRERAGPEISRPDSLDNIHSEIQDPGFREVSSKLRLLVGDYSAEKVLEKAKSFEKTGDRLYFLRLWTQSHPQTEGAGTVIEYALKQIIQNTDYAHDAGPLRELAEPLPYLDSEDEIERLVRIFDQQKQQSIQVEELVRLEILLAQAEAKIDIDRADDRLLDLYLDVEQISDLAVQTEGWARLIAVLPLRQDLTDLEENILVNAAEDLEVATKELLAKSADQVDATRHVIEGLASNRPEKALDLANRLNTKPRRDKGVLLFLGSILNDPLGDIELGIVFQALDQIESDVIRTEAVSRIYERLADERENLQLAAESAERFLGEVKQMCDAEERCKTAIQGYNILIQAGKEEDRPDEEIEKSDEFLSIAREAFKLQDDNYKKITAAFRIVSQLADSDCETAREFKDRAEQLREEIILDSSRSRSSYLANLDLVVRSFRGLLPREVDESRDSRRIISAIDRVRSLEDKVRYLSELSFSYFRSGRDQEGRQIVEEKIRPLLGQVPDGDCSLVHNVWTYCAPALYMAANNRTLSDLEKELPPKNRDKALLNIAKAILNKVMPSEPVDSRPNRRSKLRPEEIHDLIKIMENIEKDSILYRVIEKTSKAILEDKNKRTYDRGFRVDVASKMEEIASECLPNQEFIEHDGYLILAKADILLVRGTYKSVGTKSWLDLVDEARSIENEADRALVLSKLAEKCPSSGGSAREHRIEVLEDVEDLIKKLPTAQDRISRFNILAQAAEEVDRGLARRYYEGAFSLLYDERENVDESTLKNMRRRILSSAYRIDPDFASSLANLADDDPAHQQELERNIQRLKRRSSISTDANEEEEDDNSNLPSVCWESLAALNAGRLNPVRIDRAKGILSKARHLRMKGAYPIQSFITEGLVESYKDTDEASKIIRPVFEASLQNAHFIRRLAVRSSSKQDQVKAQASRQAEDSERKTFTIRTGERTKALSILREWVSDHVSERLVICDQYFGPGQIDALNLVQSVAPNCEIEILSSEKHHREENAMNLKEAYTMAWRENYDQEIPNLQIVVAGKQDGTKRSPIHDRWWLSEQSGLRLGTSFNGLGEAQSSEIGFLDESERARKIEEVERYLIRKARDHDGVKVSYQTAVL